MRLTRDEILLAAGLLLALVAGAVAQQYRHAHPPMNSTPEKAEKRVPERRVSSAETKK
jgi:hypothetical protein